MYYTEQTVNQKFIIAYGVSAVKSFCIADKESYDALRRMKNEPVKFLQCFKSPSVTIHQMLQDFPELEILIVHCNIELGDLQKLPEQIVYFQARVNLHVDQLNERCRGLTIDHLHFENAFNLDLPSSLRYLKTGLTIHQTIVPAQTIRTLSNLHQVEMENTREFVKIILKRKSNKPFDHIEFVSGNEDCLIDSLRENGIHFVVPWHKIRCLINLQIESSSWPDALKTVKMYKGKLVHLLPERLKKLAICKGGSCDESVLNALPPNLKHLALDMYNGKLILPASLQYIKLDQYNDASLPYLPQLKELYLSKYNQELAFPLSSKLQVLHLPRYTHYIPPLPCTLRSININAQ